MDTGLLVPIGAFAAVVLIVAIISLTKMRDKEMEVQQGLHLEELEHQRKMKELNLELERVRQGSQADVEAVRTLPFGVVKTRGRGEEE